jgi:hypothetical protein
MKKLSILFRGYRFRGRSPKWAHSIFAGAWNKVGALTDMYQEETNKAIEEENEG